MQTGKIGITALITLLTATTTAFTPNFPVPLYALPVVAQTQSNRKAEADRLVEQGNKQIDTNQLQFALLSYQEALANYQQIGDRESEKTTLTKLGDTYAALKEFSIAIEYHKQALSIWRELLDRQWEEKKRTFSENTNSSALPGQVNSQDPERKSVADVNYLYHGQYLISQRSIYEGMLLRDRVIIGMAQNRAGVSLPQVLPEVLKVYQQELAESRKLGNRIIEGETLNLIGTTYIYLGEYSQAIQSYQQALAIFQDIALQPREEEIFNGLPTEEEFSKAPSEVEAVQLALAMIPSEIRLGSLFNNLGEVYRRQGKYAQALASYQEALSNFQYFNKNDVKTPEDELIISMKFRGEGTAFNNIGLVYSELGQYSKALDSYLQALAIHQVIDPCSLRGKSLHNIGALYERLERYSQSLEVYQEALAAYQKCRDRVGEARTFDGIGIVYRKLGQYSRTLDYYRQSLAQYRELGERVNEGDTLHNFGVLYSYLDQSPQALEAFHQALAINREIGDKAGEKLTLSNIGFLLETQNQPELAIVFFKQSVNVTEAIRRDIRGLPKEQQQSYIETVASTYRRLADLLLKQDRILEAQRVLDLLKVQELEDYLSNVRGNNNTAQGLPNLPPEQQIEDSYESILDQAIQVGKELTQLRQIKPQNRNPQQEQRIAQLVKVQEQIIAQFNNFIESPEVEALINQLTRTAKRQNLELEDLIALQDNLKNLQQNAVLLYPLILDDRIELILTTPDSPPIRRTVQVPQKQLNQTIAAFRSALKHPSSDAKTPAQQLYNWLIKPLEADLKAADAQTIIYAPDAQLRYIPLAALYDGQQWLVQRYRINNITAASLTDLNTKPQPQMQVLAGAFATGRYSFTVGGQSFDFSGLPFAGTEVENLAKTVPTTTKLIDKAFTPEVTVPKMDDYTVVHLATHAAFVVGTPDDSFIVFGNGERITLRDIQTWSLKNVDLVVLSACETGLGGKLGNGEEILGLGYQMQRAGARAAIASLWTVDDGGTQSLMNAFYSVLQGGKLTKAEALRQAQIALITGDYQALGQERGIIVVQERITDSLSPQVANRLNHPYYWAPFILIGNGL